MKAAMGENVMVKSPPQTRDLESVEPTRSQDDLALLKSIANDRDANALSQLIQRYQAAAFSLALRITGNKELAEEALQESLVKVWNGAASFREMEGGTVSGWLLRIVAREGLMVLRGQRKTQIEKEHSMTRPDTRDDSSPSAVLEHEEVLSALREELNEMPELEQRMLALHFGGGLSQQEVGEALRIPRRTVTFKIDECVKGLRTRLARNGFAAAVPLVTAGGLSEAICSGHPVPPYLHERVLRQIANHGGGAISNFSRRSASAKPAASLLLMAGAMALVAALVAGAGLLYKDRQLSSAAPASPAAFAPNSPKASPAPAIPAPLPAKDAPLNRTWTFEQGPAKDLEVIQGEWTWKSGQSNRAGYMEAPKTSAVLVRLPVKIPAHPMVIKVDARMVSFNEWSMGGFWFQGNQTVPHVLWSRFLRLPTTNPNPEATVGQFEIYVFDRYIAALREDQVFLVREHHSAYPSERFTLSFKNWNIEKIELRSIEQDQIPAVLQNIPQLVKELGLKAVSVKEDGQEEPLLPKQSTLEESVK